MNFKTLSQFYTSTTWRKFRRSVIAERVNKEDGHIYCEYSGEKLLKDSDIIAHHKIELTSQNMNDPSISLNPENIMIVSHKSHDIIHERFGGRLKAHQKKVYLVYGSPLSGKTSYVKKNKGDKDLVLDIDNLWEALSGEDRYIKPNSIKRVVFDVRDKILDCIKTRQGHWPKAWIISGMPLLIERMRLIETLGAEPILIEATEVECLERLSQDERRKNIPEYKQYIKDWFSSYQEEKECDNY